MTTRTTIGDFRSGQKGEARRGSTAAEESGGGAESAAPESVPATTVQVTSGEGAATTVITAGEEYLERLKEAKITLQEAMAIYDAVLTKGYYEEYVRLRGNRRAVFRTRQYEDNLRLQTILELQRPQLIINQEDLITRYNLAASLYEWDGKVLKHETDADFDAVLAMIRRMPGPLFTLLSRELAKFDQKIMLVFSDGATENF